MSPFIVGRKYALSSANGQQSLEVEAMPGPKADLLCFRVSNGYVRILEDGVADTKGGGGGWCHFGVEMHDSGLVSLVRGPFRLSSGDQGRLTSTSNTSPVPADALWTVAVRDAESQLLRLHQGAFCFGPFRREDSPGGVVRLHCVDGYLRISNGNGAVDANGPGGPQCQFMMKTEGDFICLQCVVEPHRWLGVNSRGALTGCEVERARQMFRMESVSFDGPTPSAALGGFTVFDESVDLTSDQRRAFVKDGFIILREVVPPSLVAAALAHINSALLMPGSVFKNDDGAVQICPDAGKQEVVLALLRDTPLWTLAQRLLGRGRLTPCGSAQVALRGPNLNGTPLIDGAKPKQWHIDGMDSGKHSPFSLLLGVALSDQSQPNCGNLAAFPGSHHVLHPLLRAEVDARSSVFSNEDGEGKPSLMGGQQILLRAGDAVLLHQKVAHRVGVNLSSNIRYQTYFRLRHTDHAKKLEDGSLLDDLWTEFEGLANDMKD